MHWSGSLGGGYPQRLGEYLVDAVSGEPCRRLGDGAEQGLMVYRHLDGPAYQLLGRFACQRDHRRAVKICVDDSRAQVGRAGTDRAVAYAWNAR